MSKGGIMTIGRAIRAIDNYNNLKNAIRGKSNHDRPDDRERISKLHREDNSLKNAITGKSDCDRPDDCERIPKLHFEDLSIDVSSISSSDIVRLRRTKRFKDSSLQNSEKNPHEKIDPLTFNKLKER